MVSTNYSTQDYKFTLPTKQSQRKGERKVKHEKKPRAFKLRTRQDEKKKKERTGPGRMESGKGERTETKCEQERHFNTTNEVVEEVARDSALW